ncbi:cartilage matrix protein-like [Clinocottus analis]|uniref:cartilage matrix protein-like n=1 Tax=Clinocottus analis TaxID=304258 RepID=UPI0035C0129D
MRSLALGLLCVLCCSAVQQDRRRLRPVAAESHNETKPAENVCKATPLDFVFVIDSSRSIRPDDYEKVKAFIVNLLRFLQVGPAATRVGLLQYGSVVRPEFSLNTYTTEAQVERAVRGMEHLATGTMTGLALQYAMETAFTEEEGARPAGLLIPRVAMVVTDGRPQDTVEEVAAQARRAGIQIFAVGVGRVDMSTLKAIGSEPHSEHVHLVANFSQIETLISVFQDKLCGGSETCEVVEHQCQHICVSSPASYRCKCRKGFTLNPDGKTCTEPECGAGVVDLVFVIDGSKSLGPANFQLVKQFVNVIVDSLDISRAGVHVGLLQYSTKVRTEFPLGRHSAARAVKQAVSRVQYMGRGSMTGAALRHMFQSSFSAKEGARPGVPRVGIVFTDGRAQDDVSGWAEEAKNSGVTLYALGVGKAIERELREIASEPEEKHLYYAEDFEKMGEITKKLKSSICEDKPSGESACRCESVMMFHTQVTQKLKTLAQSIEAITDQLDTLQNQVARK